MSDSYLDNLPSGARERIRKRMRSPEEYERLREKVKGPEDLEREMDKNAEFAEAKLSLETDRETQEKAKEQIKALVAEQGIEGVLEEGSEAAKQAIERGRFEVGVRENRHEPHLAISLKNAPSSATEAPSGNVQEALAIKPSLQQQLLSSLIIRKEKGNGPSAR